MPITAVCPSCSKSYRLKDSFAGKRVRCSECDTSFFVDNLDAKRAAQPGIAAKTGRQQKSNYEPSGPRESVREVRSTRIVGKRISASSNSSPERRTSKKKKPVSSNQNLYLTLALFVGGLVAVGSAGYLFLRPAAAVSQSVATNAVQDAPAKSTPALEATRPPASAPKVSPKEIEMSPTIAASKTDSAEVSTESMAGDAQPKMSEEVRGEMSQPTRTEDTAAMELVPLPMESAPMPAEKTDTSRSVVELGESAPDFELELLDGEKFRLSEQGGKVIILDFWATWCGPCRKSLPLVDRLAKEFRSKGVELYAINVGEKPEEATSMLSKLNLRMNVPLDRDSAVSGKYLVSSIPRTVVIDREGKVIALFSGISGDILRQLRAAVKSAAAKRAK